MKKPLHTFIRTLLLAQVLLLTACADTLFGEPPVTGGLSFAVSTHEMTDQISSGTSATTRGTTAKEPQPVRFDKPLAEQPLYLRAAGVAAIGMHNTEDNNATATRGTVVTNDTFYDSFLAAAYDTDDPQANVLDGVHTVSRANSWSFGEGWPDGKSLRFFALAPVGVAQMVGLDKAATAQISYTVPDNVTDQKDLMGAVSAVVSEAPETPIKLDFYHMLTCVRFAIDNVKQGITINKITLHNIYSAGSYAMVNLLKQNYDWIVSTNSKKDFTYNLDFYVQSQNHYIQHGESVFLLLPQTLPDDATVEISIKDRDGSTKSLTAKIGGQEWKTGHTVTYHVSTSSINTQYQLVVTQSADFAYSGDGQGNITVTSYKQDLASQTTTAEPWTIDGYSTDGGKTFTTTKPNWLTLQTTSGSGSDTGENITTEVKPRTDNEKTYASATHHENLANSSIKGADDWTKPVDLSYRDAYGNTLSSQNTANCYVVRGPGWYEIPMVYGNSLVNGKANVGARYTTNTNDHMLQNFVSSNGGEIKKVWINQNFDWPNTSDDSKNNGTTRRAAVIWKDIKADVMPQSGVATDISGGEGYLRFYVNKDNIYQGNVVLGLYDSNDAKANLVWSYHIWITDEDLTPISVTNAKGKVNKMMPVPLGFVDKNDKSWWWPERSVVVRVRQTNNSDPTSNYATFTVTQHKGRYLEGYSTYYQWGRKDPLPAVKDIFFPGPSSDGKVKHNVPNAFSSASTEALSNHTVAGAISASIVNPTVMYCDHTSSTSCPNWLPTDITNLWDVNNTTSDTYDTPVTKCIYDPCPYPFHVPNAGVYTGFVDSYNATGTNSKMDTWNIAETSYHNGWNFYTESDNSRSYNVFFVPAQGHATATNGGAPYIDNKDTEGSYWTAGYKDGYTRGGALFYHYEATGGDKDISPLTNSNDGAARWIGRAIIPMTEE